MSNWNDDLNWPNVIEKTRQTWIGTLTAAREDYDALRVAVDEARRPSLDITVVTKTADSFIAEVRYGPVKGANRTDMTRFFDKIGVNYELQTVVTEVMK